MAPPPTTPPPPLPPAAAAPVAGPLSPPSFGQEVEEGNREYKLKLLRPSSSRLTHLATQLHWRLNESPKGEAVYLLGVRDDGHPEGLAEGELRESLATLRRMARGVKARVLRVRVGAGVTGRVAEVLLRREESRRAAPQELRIAVLGRVDGGKSTLVGVLTQGRLDNGQGLARMQVFRHGHEVMEGRTSSVARHTLGFLPDGGVVNYRTADAPGALSAEELVQRSSKLVSFLDLAGHARYLKTTLSGMVGLSPDYAMLSVAATASRSSSSPSSSPKEEEEEELQGLKHLDIALALGVPFFAVVTKIDLVTPGELARTLARVARALATATGRKAQVVASEEELVALLSEEEEEVGEAEEGKVQGLAEEGGEGNDASVLSSSSSSSFSSSGSSHDDGSSSPATAGPPAFCRRLLPIFPVSNVTGHNLELLRHFLRALPNTRPWRRAQQSRPSEFHVDHAFRVSGVGTVLAGAVHRGSIAVGDHMLLGPDRGTGCFRPVVVRSVHVDRVAVRSASAGQCASVAFKTLSSPAQPMEGSSGGEGETSQSSSSSSSSSSDDDEDEDGDEDEEEAYGEEVGSSPSQRQTKEKERWLRRCYRGTVLVSPEACPAAVWEFEAEVEVISASSSSSSSQPPSPPRALSLAVNHEAVVHVHTLRQTARVLSVLSSSTAAAEVVAPFSSSTTTATSTSIQRCRLRFLSRAEYVSAGMTVVLRHSETLAVGRVVATYADGQEQGERRDRRHSI